MSQKLLPTLIGIFVVGAVVLGVFGTMFFGSGEAFAEKRPAIMYFEGSLAGLDVGAPVMFRGVNLGVVKDIVLTYYPEERRTEIPVLIELRPNRVRRVGGEGFQATGYNLRQLIQEEGLRGQLVTQSFVTGKVAIQLDFHPDKEIRLLCKDDTILEIPTIPSKMKQLEEIAFNELVEDFWNAVQGFGELVRNPELKEAIHSVRTTVDDFGKLARHIDGEVDPISTGAQEALVRASVALTTLDTVIAEDSTLHYRITYALKEIAAAAQLT